MLTRLSEWKYVDKHNPFQIKDYTYTYLNNLNGIQNRYLAEFDSTISYVDTATHYRYFTKSYPLTNYSRNILEHDYSPSSGSYAEIIYLNGKYNMYYDALVEDHTISGLVNTKFRETLTNELHKKDSLEQLRIRLIEEDRRMQDTLTKPLYEYFEQNELIDINKYIFEEEKKNYYKRLLRKDYVDIDLDTAEFELPKIRIYETSFYNNYIANQIDFGFLNNAYQSFTGGAVYYNPGLNMLFKIGANDLFEDYKIIGGFRFSGNFDSNEYLLSFESLKGKFDKQFIFHRQAFNTSAGDRTYVKIHSHEILYSMRYPLNQVTSLKGTMSIRNDRNVYLATDTKNLQKENEYRTWASLKLEFIYDNTRIKGINLYNGTRFKIFGEVYRQIDRKKSDLFVLGADFRHYQKIHRDLIWANRLAASTSFGTNKLIYYLGGVDNWMNLFGKIETFDQSVPIDPTQKYIFQALATNMRGFSQNIRNGNSFVVINSEIRWPVFRYFINRPIGSNFFNNFQIVGFADLGTAWTGEHPYLGQNAYDKKIINNPPITVTIDANREPVVAGFGFGLRSQLFGYFIRTDWAWGIENHVLLPRIFYLSLNLDF
ncbi:hypothetical protein ES705_23148 [subsurface metagenome]